MISAGTCFLLIVRHCFLRLDVEGIYLFTSRVPDQSVELCISYMEEQCAGTDQHLHVILFNVDDYDVNGAIPSRYANITKTAESLRYLAHSTGGRFHWFRETGDDRRKSFVFAFSIFWVKFSFPILSDLVFLLTVFLHIFLYNITPSQLGSSYLSLLHLLSHIYSQCRHLITQCNLEWYSFYENHEKQKQ